MCHSDFKTMLAFSETCKHIRTYAIKEQYKTRAKDFVKAYLYRRVSYWVYLREDGRNDISKLALKILGLGFGIFSAYKARQESSQIPSDTPMVEGLNGYKMLDDSYPHVKDASRWEERQHLHWALH